MARKTLLKRITPPKQVTGEIAVPGDKSISHRAIILNSLAQGNSRISNLSTGKDCLSTINCLRVLGTRIIKQDGEQASWLIYGVGTKELSEPHNVLNAGNSATTMRLLAAPLAAQPFLSILTGDASLRSRPMRRLIEPLRLMGAELYGRGEDSFAPLAIKGRRLHGISYRLPVPSAQIKSALLLAGLFAEGTTTIEQPEVSRDHTERLLKRMGARIESSNNHVSVTSLTSQLVSLDLHVPGDISSAAYWLVAAAVHPDAKVRITNCGINPTRTGIIDVLIAMGARLRVEKQRMEGNEPVADLYVESSRLRGVEIDREMIPRLIDEVPALAVAACAATGDTVIRGASELRMKESDRIATTVREFSRLGAKIDELPDGMVIHGGGRLVGAEVRSYSDHRLAMSLAIAALIAKGPTTIHHAQVADVSYPGFWVQLEKLARY
jgi:3-phosphoshikimate 1-carboxyvinyltransferase